MLIALCAVIVTEQFFPERLTCQFNPARKLDFIFPVQQRNLAHLGQIHPNRVVDAVLDLGGDKLFFETLVVLDVGLSDAFLIIKILNRQVKVLFGFLLDICFIENFHSHFVQGRQHTVQASGSNSVVRQFLIQLLVSEEALFAAFFNELLYLVLEALCRERVCRCGVLGCLVHFSCFNPVLCQRRCPFINELTTN